MDFFNRNAPAYRGNNSQPQARNGLFSGLFGNLLGGGTPSYKTGKERRAQASAPDRGWWQVFLVTPSYKTPSPTTDVPEATAPPPVTTISSAREWHA